jgi:hypothetical protein
MSDTERARRSDRRLSKQPDQERWSFTCLPHQAAQVRRDVLDDYKIEVTYQGKTKEKTIRLIGGDKLEMSFNFTEREANKIASN